MKKMIKLQTTIKTNTAPWMDKVRKTTIKERKSAALKSSPSRPLADSASIELKCSDESIAKRVKQCAVADKVVEECEHANSSSEAVWRTEDFGWNIYSRTWTKVDDILQKHPHLNQKIIWQLVISVEDTNLESSAWYQRKFGLDSDFLRKTSSYSHHDLTLRMASPGMDPISEVIASEMSGLIFALPEANHRNSKEDMESYWNAYSARLEALVKQIEEYNPTARFPILICYFPVGEDAAITLQRISLALGLERHNTITD
ncbi:hypothetical protein CU097_008273 [Rhizopus azygosporus]|uniref:Uncharacterized protein n=2 Tax=Rhizopus TaxID=4842 RepID=A0A367JIW6_RHIAZ|nr:hypothetical protein CU097_008273 [Rhizopus azygosporus]